MRAMALGLDRMRVLLNDYERESLTARANTSSQPVPLAAQNIDAVTQILRDTSALLKVLEDAVQPDLVVPLEQVLETLRLEFYVDLLSPGACENAKGEQTVIELFDDA